VGIVGNEAADRLANQGCWLPEVPEQDWDLLAVDVEARKVDTAERVKGGADAFEVQQVAGRRVGGVVST
jgi:hypothetical protein